MNRIDFYYGRHDDERGWWIECPDYEIKRKLSVLFTESFPVKSFAKEYEFIGAFHRDPELVIVVIKSKGKFEYFGTVLKMKDFKEYNYDPFKVASICPGGDFLKPIVRNARPIEWVENPEDLTHIKEGEPYLHYAYGLFLKKEEKWRKKDSYFSILPVSIPNKYLTRSEFSANVKYPYIEDISNKLLIEMPDDLQKKEEEDRVYFEEGTDEELLESQFERRYEDDKRKKVYKVDDTRHLEKNINEEMKEIVDNRAYQVLTDEEKKELEENAKQIKPFSIKDAVLAYEIKKEINVQVENRVKTEVLNLLNVKAKEWRENSEKMIEDFKAVSLKHFVEQSNNNTTLLRTELTQKLNEFLQEQVWNLIKQKEREWDGRYDLSQLTGGKNPSGSLLDQDYEERDRELVRLRNENILLKNKLDQFQKLSDQLYDAKILKRKSEKESNK